MALKLELEPWSLLSEEIHLLLCLMFIALHVGRLFVCGLVIIVVFGEEEGEGYITDGNGQDIVCFG